MVCGIVWLSQLAGFVTSVSATEQYTEHLQLRQAQSYKVIAHFNFSRQLDQEALDRARQGHYHVLPRAIGNLLDLYRVKELHLSMTQGRWPHDHLSDAASAAATGTQLWAWISDAPDPLAESERGLDAQAIVDKRWRGLTNALSGIFCASLNYLDRAISAEPVSSFRPTGAFRPGDGDVRLRYGALPREFTCTENLTPWLKLLPCGGKAGLGTLLNPSRIYDTEYHSMGFHVARHCADAACTAEQLRIDHTIAMVQDFAARGQPVAWSLDALFGQRLGDLCYLSDATTLGLQIDPDHPFEVVVKHDPESAETWDVHRLKQLASRPRMAMTVPLDARDRHLNVGVHWQPDIDPPPVSARVASTTPFVAHRHISGYGQQDGVIVVDFRNRLDHAVPITYLEVLPWYVRMYAHSLRVGPHGQDESLRANPYLQKVVYQPAIDRERPHMLELKLVVPPSATLRLAFAFDKAFIKYTEHPPDANRGFDIGSGIVTLRAPVGDLPQGTRLMTETLLLSLATPDFSMPYNVITMTCTLIALFFGSYCNLLTRSFHLLKRVTTFL
ncbi:hypothetical protein CXG81DRAFT_10743 [Caulochytrium protostelioides]|uniref:Gpi16 subunit, GPI transamidase component n=1 Tax=Caulochytrium protostelioides TaxID=1555241 RepID=A0A4P9XAU3_9FUNG|nr:hypothetical protein CXG81DRAFT_10743 [Caulochytrium protostelioides]|eukprot:RKP02472.1 hypothetical protein CXG81DRAFT_10743 [Caulochytrium protostelioides]